MTPKLLNPEELEAARIWFGSAGPNGANGRLLLAHIAALEADNAALLALWQERGCLDLGPRVDRGAPSSCIEQGWPLTTAGSCPACRAAGQPHPGATLLSEHAKEVENGKAERDRLRDGLMEEARWGAVGRAAALALRPFSRSDAELLDVVLQRALVRARNEGLERARKYVHENLHLVPEAAAIDAMKETEP